MAFQHKRGTLISLAGVFTAWNRVMMDIAVLSVFAFAAGLIDAAVGGGGLIQIPALFNVLPTAQPAALLGSNKLASASSAG